VGLSGDTPETTYAHCRRHYGSQVRKIRKAQEAADREYLLAWLAS
jgi:hypothetical protein